MELPTNTWIWMLVNFGYPIVVSFWLFWRFEKKLNGLTSELSEFRKDLKDMIKQLIEKIK
jgi:hypothetical protein